MSGKEGSIGTLVPPGAPGGRAAQIPADRSRVSGFAPQDSRAVQGSFWLGLAYG